jgi:glutathione S-transferase
MLALYGHPFSSYTWKALIALYDRAIPFEFRSMEEEANGPVVAAASPQGKFPLLIDGAEQVFEATAIIEWLGVTQSAAAGLIPADPIEAVRVRMIDRVFDNYVMNVMQDSVDEAIRTGTLSEETRDRVGSKLERSYRWIEQWLGTRPDPGRITLIECAAAPSLFYTDWVHPVPPDCLRLRQWRAHLLALPAVSRCVEDARPFRHYFPLGAPDRD